MNRDINKLIADYDKLIAGDNDYLFTSDMQQILDLVRADHKDDNNIIFDLVDKAMIVGFMIGYKEGQTAAAN